MPIRAQIVPGNGRPIQPTAGTGTPCSPRTAHLVGQPSASGNQLAIAGSDTSIATDAGVLNAERVIAGADSGTGTDAGALSAKRVFAGSDVGTAADAGSIAAKRIVAGADSALAGDAGTINAERRLGGSDTSTGSDTGVIATQSATPPPPPFEIGPAGAGCFNVDRDIREESEHRKEKRQRRRSADRRRDMIPLSRRELEDAAAITESDVVRAQSAWNDDAPDEWVNLLYAGR